MSRVLAVHVWPASLAWLSIPVCWFSLPSTSLPPSLPLENCSSTHFRILISLLMLLLKSGPKRSHCTDQRQLYGAIMPPLKREPCPLKNKLSLSVWLFSKTKQNKNKQKTPNIHRVDTEKQETVADRSWEVMEKLYLLLKFSVSLKKSTVKTNLTITIKLKTGLVRWLSG